MKKSLFLLVALLLGVIQGWAQPVAGNPVTSVDTVTVNHTATTVDIPVRVADFTAVGNISLVFYYPHSEIYSPSIVYIDPGLDVWETFEANFGTTDSITISAYDPNTEEPVTGLTLDDGDILFTIRFTIGTITDFANIIFYENSEGTSCEIGGIGPDYTPFIDTPMGDYYHAGGVELIDLNPGSIGTAQYICEGDDAAAFTSTADASGEGTITYQWQSKTNAEGAVFADIEGATSATYDAGALSQDMHYRRKAATILDGVSENGISNEITVTVINFSTETISAAQTICEGSDVSALASGPAWGDGTFSYQWQSSTTSGTEGFSDIEGATATSYDPGTITADTWYRCETSASLGGSTCVEYSNVVKITVINFVPGAISGSQTFCEGTDATAFTSPTAASGDGSIVYQWQQSTTSGTEGFSDIEGETSATYDAGVLSVDTWYRREATSSLNGSSCTEYSNVLSITVINLNPGVIGSNQHISEGADAAALTSETDVTGDGTVDIQWQVSTTSGTEGFSDIEGATTSTYDPGTLTADTWYRRESTSTIDVTSCTEYSNVVAVIVVNFIPGEISEDQISCQDDVVADFSSIVEASGDGTITYQWQKSTTSGTEGFSDITDATLATHAPGSLNTDTWFRRKAIATLGGFSFIEHSNVVAASVIGLDPGAIGNAQTICTGDDPAGLTSITGATGEGTVVYQWQASTTGASEGFLDIEGATAETYNPGVTTVNTWFRRQASTTVFETQCNKYTNVILITANPLRSISGIFYYYHSAGNIAITDQSITVNLYKTSDIAHEALIDSDVTDENGFYEFTGLCPECDYDLVATSNATNIGAINTTDAAQTNYWATHPTIIEKVKFFAADIGTQGMSQDLTVNSTDAGRIQHYFVYGTPFDRKWTYWKAGSTICQTSCTEEYPQVYLLASGNLTQNMLALCTGDFNRSFNPVMTKSASSTLQLVYNGNRVIGSGEEFDLPVRLVNASGVGAISLILNFPAELVEISDVAMPNAGGQLDWAVNGNELRIGWNSSTPLYLSDNAEFITLRLKASGTLTSGTPVLITLANNPLNEIADEMFDVIGNAVLGIDAVNGNALGIGENQTVDMLAFSNYPNPFSNATTLSYYLPENGMVTLEINSLMGNRSIMVMNEMKTAGFYKERLSTDDLPSGIYAATLRLKSSNNEWTRSIKLIKNN